MESSGGPWQVVAQGRADFVRTGELRGVLEGTGGRSGGRATVGRGAACALPGGRKHWPSGCGGSLLGSFAHDGAP